MSVFLLSLAFVLAFVPGMLDPFTGGTQEETVTVNRVADDLSQSLLGNASEPYVLDSRCTRGFFEAGAVSDCEYSGSSIQERVGVKPYQRVNVTISGNVSAGPETVLCWDGSEFAERDDASCTTVLARGANPELSGSRTVSATRVVRLAGHDVTLEVEMW